MTCAYGYVFMNRSRISLLSKRNKSGSTEAKSFRLQRIILGCKRPSMSKENPSLEDIRSRRREIAEEDRELALAETTLVRLAQKWAGTPENRPARQAPIETPISADVAPPKASSLPVGYFSKEANSRRTKNAIIIEALEKPRPLWQTAKEIQGYFRQEFGSEMRMSSISPALTALKNDGALVRKDMFVALTLRVEDEEPDFLKMKEASAEEPADASKVTDGAATPSSME